MKVALAGIVLAGLVQEAGEVQVQQQQSEATQE